jgi:Family of unknown function (DUF5719)
VSRALGRGRLLFALLVVVVLAGIYEGAGAIHPAAAAGGGQRTAAATRPGRATVSTAVRLCPAPGSGATSASVAVAALSGATSGGSAVISALTPSGSPTAGAVVATARQPGTLHVFRVRAAAPLTSAEQAGQPGSSPDVTTAAARGGVQVSASGAMAQGLAVEQTGPGGLVTWQCGTPGTDFWFLGPGQQSAGTIELYLMNAGSSPADAQVSLLTDVTKGPPLLGNSDNGITVPPHSMVVQSLSKLIQSSQVIALNVTTNAGQVVAAVKESRSAASDSGSWLPVTQPPARKIVIPGLPGEGGSRELYVAVPGTAAAQVKITAVTSRGSYVPTGGSGIDLLGGSTSTVSLPSMSAVAGAITISSSVPVVASLRAPGGPSGAPGAIAVSGAPIAQQGVLAANPAHSAGTTNLVLSAPGKAATVRITTATSSVSAAGQPGQVVQIKARSSVVIPVQPPAGSKADQFAVVVTPLSGSGPVYAGQVISSGRRVQSIMPVSSALSWIQLPPAQESLTQILSAGS